jgi:hypothetical protein
MGHRAMKTGLAIPDIKAEVTEHFQQSENGKGFQLEQLGYW